MTLSNDRLIELFEERIQSVDLPSEPNNLYEPILFTLESGGKRIRPVMVLISNGIFSDDIEKAMNAALAIEVFHNFTLLHDDIMDNADVRRTRPTVHKKWNSNIAILSGDTMLIHSYKLLAKCECKQFHNIFDSFNTLAALVCEGQQIDMDFETTSDVDIDRYISMIALKTSALIAGALKIGAQIADAGVEECDLLYDFGMNIGNAFQLKDDLLDTYGDEKTFGKRIGGDIIEGKKTFLLITALNHADKTTKEILRNTISDTTISEEEKIGRVRSIYDSLNVKEITQNKINYYFDNAMSIISKLNVSDEKKSGVIDIAKRLIHRDK